MLLLELGGESRRGTYRAALLLRGVGRIVLMFARVWEKTSCFPIEEECGSGQRIAIY